MRGQHGLLEWFSAQRGKSVSGYTRAIFSGLTTQVLSEMIAKLIARKQRLERLFHAALSPISKHDLLNVVKNAYSLLMWIEPSPEVVIDRSARAFLDAVKYVQEGQT